MRIYLALHLRKHSEFGSVVLTSEYFEIKSRSKRSGSSKKMREVVDLQVCLYKRDHEKNEK